MCWWNIGNAPPVIVRVLLVGPQFAYIRVLAVTPEQVVICKKGASESTAVLWETLKPVGV